MKKVIAIALALLMLLSFAACKGAEGGEPADSGNETVDTSTPAKALFARFKEIAETETDVEVIAQKLSEANDIFVDQMMGSMPVEEGFLNGFTEEINGFTKGAIFSPMIGTIPFVGYVFETEDAEALKATLKEKADLRWNICTQADEMLVESEGNLVFFVMSPASFEVTEDDMGDEGADIELPEIPDELAPSDEPVYDGDAADIQIG